MALNTALLLLHTVGLQLNVFFLAVTFISSACVTHYAPLFVFFYIILLKIIEVAITLCTELTSRWLLSFRFRELNGTTLCVLYHC